jgi:hypothetical protein
MGIAENCLLFAYFFQPAHKQKQLPTWEAAWSLEARAGVEPTYTDLQSRESSKPAQSTTNNNN